MNAMNSSSPTSFNFVGLQDEQAKRQTRTVIENLQTNREAILAILANSDSLSPQQIQNLKKNLRVTTELINMKISEAQLAGRNLSDSLKGVSNNMVNQLVITDVLGTEVKNSRNELQALKEDNNNKLRMVQINTYFSEKYRDQTELFKLIIYFIIPLILILINKSLIPKNIGYLIGGIIILVGGYMVVTKIYDINNRNNMNFEEYNINTSGSFDDQNQGVDPSDEDIDTRIDDANADLDQCLDCPGMFDWMTGNNGTNETNGTNGKNRKNGDNSN